jgi:hypothetical protein
MTEEFLTPTEVSRILNISYRTTCDRLNKKYDDPERIPGIKLGNWRIPKGELQRWMDEKGMKRGIDYVW